MRFQLSYTERDEVVANCDHLRRLKFSPTMPFAFTEHGALIAASVLDTPRAMEVRINVVRAAQDSHRPFGQLTLDASPSSLNRGSGSENPARMYA